MNNEPVPSLPLNNGVQIPQLGFGVFKVPPEQTRDAVSTALDIGYRHIDTAQMYRNERGVGEALAASGLDREDYFVTSKLNNAFHGHDDALAAFDLTLEELQLQHVDLFLIHWPLPSQGKYVEAWKALVQLQQEGRIRSIGVSNFNQDHLERIIGETGVTPVVNQIELHPSFQQRDKRAYLAQHDIKIESWSPLGSGRALGNPVLGEIAQKHGKTVAQVIIRWHLQEGLIVIPKSTHRERMEENIAVFDFELDAEDMQHIAGLDDPAGGRIGSDPAKASFLF